ncbi:MAG TPA: FAD-dependent oxidoreductase, partial [Bacillales bacterium]|nr:FAD-dependent oxidoreductase [Bacillales bacterium]
DGTMPWDSFSEGRRISKTLDSLSQVHGNQVYREFMVGTSKSWAHDPLNGGGDFAFYRPNQMTYLKEAIKKPEGRIHFAGEHASDYHGWIEGAVESGVRAALEVHQQEK